MSPPSDCRLENPKVQRAHSPEDAEQELAKPLIVKLKLLYNNAASQPTEKEATSSGSERRSWGVTSYLDGASSRRKASSETSAGGL
jgi:hypothetical protein